MARAALKFLITSVVICSVASLPAPQCAKPALDKSPELKPIGNTTIAAMTEAHS